MNDPDPLQATFERWWREHTGIFHKVSRLYADAPDERADLVQDMLVQLWRSLPRFAGQCAPATWIYRVCLNTALTWRRDETRRRHRVFAVETPPDAACPQPAPDARHEQNERLETLYTAIRRLPKPERSIILLHLDGLAYREISEITGLSENQVGVSLTRSRKKLQLILNEISHEL